MKEEERLQSNSVKTPEDVGVLIHILSHQLKRRVLCTSEKDSGGLTEMQHRTIHYLLEQCPVSEVYQKDVEKVFNIRKSTATEMLQLMEKKGFLYRECSAKDARMKKIVPTEKAVAVQMAVAENIRGVEERLRMGISEEDFRICMKVLRKMTENLSCETEHEKADAKKTEQKKNKKKGREL